MAGKKLTVVLSQAQGKHPIRSKLEEEVAAALLFDPQVSISLVPHLYDMAPDHTGLVFLRSLQGPFVFLSWQYPRAVHWTLDRQQIHGRIGESELIEEIDEDEEGEELEDKQDEALGSPHKSNRNIYCIDLRVSSNPQDYVDEIHRIYDLENQEIVQLSLGPIGNSNGSSNGNGSLNGNGSANGSGPVNGNGNAVNGHAENGNVTNGVNGNGSASSKTSATNGATTNGNNGLTFDLTQFILNPDGAEDVSAKEEIAQFKASQTPIKRRWYPVIDYSRCTNCMECIDFCLFGVYGVDNLDRILVEEQDNCKKGCPACSRVCPENAIIFPGHKTPAIAGAEGEVAGLKIDLSKLFGGDDANSVDLAVRERDAELMADGREMVGKSIGLSDRHTNQSRCRGERDELDDLMDELDSLGI